MSKFFVSVYAARGNNDREKEMREWVDKHVEDALIVSDAAFYALRDKIVKKARELEERFPRCRKMLYVRADCYPGGPWFILINEYLQIRCSIITKEITEDGEEVQYE